LYKSGSNF